MPTLEVEAIPGQNLLKYCPRGPKNRQGDPKVSPKGAKMIERWDYHLGGYGTYLLLNNREKYREYVY